MPQIKGEQAAGLVLSEGFIDIYCIFSKQVMRRRTIYHCLKNVAPQLWFVRLYC